MEQCCGPLAVEMVPREHCDFSTYPAKRATAQSGAFAEVQFLIIEQSCGLLAVEIIPGKHCDFSTYLAKRARAQSGSCAVVQFSVYVTELWSPGCRNCSRKALRFHHLSCEVNESLVWRMRRGADS
jgi:hypothetical protein